MGTVRSSSSISLSRYFASRNSLGEALWLFALATLRRFRSRTPNSPTPHDLGRPAWSRAYYTGDARALSRKMVHAPPSALRPPGSSSAGSFLPSIDSAQVAAMIQEVEHQRLPVILDARRARCDYAIGECENALGDAQV